MHWAQDRSVAERHFRNHPFQTVFFVLIGSLAVLLMHHSILLGYSKAWGVVWGGNRPGIGEIGDSLAVLAFLALAFSLVQSGRALEKQSEEVRLSREEMRLAREEAAEANAQRARFEVMANIRLHAQSDRDLDTRGRVVRNAIVTTNLVRLAPHALEIVVELCRKTDGGESETFADLLLEELKSHLGGGEYAGANLEGAKLDNADLRRANLDGARLQKATLAGAELHGASLRGCDLSSCDLTDAVLYEADCRDTTFAEKLNRDIPAINEATKPPEQETVWWGNALRTSIEQRDPKTGKWNPG